MMSFVLLRVVKVCAVAVRIVRTFFDTFWLRFLFRGNGIRYGRKCKAIGIPSVRVSFGGKAAIGDFFYWRTGQSSTNVGGVGSRLRVGPKGVLTIGDHVGMSNATIVCHRSVTIGNHVHVGGGVQIFDTNFHSLKPEVRNAEHEDPTAVRTAPVVIGNGCLLGTNAMICKGVTIGDNAVVGAGSVVVCDILPGEIWAGNPARKIR